MTVLDGIKKAYPDTSIVSVSGLSRIYLCSGGKYVGMDESGHLYLTEKDKAECFTFTDWGCGSTTLVACSNGKFVTLEEEDPYMKAGRRKPSPGSSGNPGISGRLGRKRICPGRHIILTAGME